MPKTTTMTMTTFPKIKIQYMDPSIIHNKRLIIIGDVHGCIATRAYYNLLLYFCEAPG